MEFFNATIAIVVCQSLLLTGLLFYAETEGVSLNPEGAKIVMVDDTAWSAWIVQHIGYVLTLSLAFAFVALLAAWIVSFWFAVSLWRAGLMSLLADLSLCLVSVSLHAMVATWGDKSCSYEGANARFFATRFPLIVVVVLSYLLPLASGLIWAWE